MPTFAAFATKQAARYCQQQHGGHLFHADNGTWYWFNLSHTLTTILCHHALRGLNGTLNPLE